MKPNVLNVDISLRPMNKFNIKECLFCKTKKPLGHFRKNPSSKDGFWSWCKQCEKMYSYYDIKGSEKYIVI